MIMRRLSGKRVQDLGSTVRALPVRWQRREFAPGNYGLRSKVPQRHLFWIKNRPL